MDDEQLMLLAKVLLGLAAAAGLWFVVRPFSSGATGWGSLAQPFGVSRLPEGERFNAVSGAMGQGLFSAKCRSLWTLSVNPSGFGLAIRSVFGQAPTIFVPWSSVESVVEKRIPFIDAAVVRIRGQANALSIYGPPGSAVAHAYARLHRTQAR